MSAIERKAKLIKDSIDALKREYEIVNEDLKDLRKLNLDEMDDFRKKRQKRKIKSTEEELEEINEQIAEKETALTRLESQVPALKAEANPAQKDFARQQFKAKSQTLGKNTTDKEKAELYELKQRMYEEMFDDFDQKFKQDYPYIIFDRLIAQNPLRPLEEKELRTFISDKNAKFYEKAMVVSALTLSLIEKLEFTRLEILLDFVLQNEAQVWQRALVGLLLALRGKDKKIDSNFRQRLENLKAIPQIQEALFYMDMAYREFQKDLKEQNSTATNLEIFAKMKNYDFFEKPQHWFLPFYPENEAAKASIDESRHNINAQEFMNLLVGSLSVCNVDKYALCFHFEELREEQVLQGGENFKSLVQIFNNEKEGLGKLAKESEAERKSIENSVFKLYFQDLYQFYTHYPKSKYQSEVLAQQELYEKTLLDLVAEDIAKIRIEAQKYFEANNYPQAKIYYEQLVQLAPDDHEAWHNLGNVYQNGLKDYPKAIEAYQKAIHYKADYHEAWNNLGNVYDDIQDYPKAIEAYQKAIEIKADKHGAWYNLGLVYAKGLQDYPKAIETFQKAIEIKADYHEAWYNLGLVYDDIQDYPKAIEAYQKAVEIKADKHEAWYNLGIVYATLENHDKAIETYRKILEIDSNNINAFLGIGWTYFIQGKIQEAKPYFEKSTIIPNSLMNLGHIALIEKEEAKAMELYQESLANFSDKNHFFEGMKDDFQYLEKQGISKGLYQEILEKLKNE